MSLFRIIPRFEIKNKNLVKGIAMEGFRVIPNIHLRIEKYLKYELSEFFFDMITSSLYDLKPNYKFFKELSDNINIPIIAAGGVNSLVSAKKYFNSGADKIALNTALCLKKKFIKDLVSIYGSQSIAAQIQYKYQGQNTWEAYFWNGRQRTKIEVIDLINYSIDNGIGEIYLISIDKDGRFCGPDQELLFKIKEKVPIPLLYGGGIRDLNDINNLIKMKIDGCLIAHALHFEKLNFTK